MNKKINNLEKCNSIFQTVFNMMIHSETSEVGWCNGDAGLLMVLAEMSFLLNKKLDLFKLAKRCVNIDETKEVDLSVCHGISGIIQSLLFVYAVTDDFRYLNLANTFWKRAFYFVNKNGFYTGERYRDYLMGYFLGWSGIIDSAILLKMFNKGEKAFLPLNLSSKDYQDTLFC